jgi:hypothetical protein
LAAITAVTAARGAHLSMPVLAIAKPTKVWVELNIEC